MGATLLLTVKEAAERLRVSAGTVYTLITAKALVHVRIGHGRGVLRIPEEAIRAYLDQQTVIPNASPPAPVRSHRLKHLSLD